MNLRAIIIDDELIGIKALQLLIENYTEGVKVVATSYQPKKAIELIEDYQPDIVFLDISMPGMSGFELLKKLKFKDFKLVFTTAHREFAIEAIKNKATDYLLKPIDLDDLKKCIEEINKEIAPPAKSMNEGIIEVAVKSGVIFLRSKDIIRLEGSGSYTQFWLKNNVKHMVSKNIKEHEAKLNPDLFFRCHASNVINLSEVLEMVSNNDGLFAKMSDGSLVEISKKSKQLFLEKLRNT